jgi:hypothetical protein
MLYIISLTKFNVDFTLLLLLVFQERMETGERTVSISVLEDESEFYKGHMIDGRNLFPATGYLVSLFFLKP